MKIILKSILILVIFFGGNFAWANDEACVSSGDNSLTTKSKWELVQEIAELREELELTKKALTSAVSLHKQFNKKNYTPRKERYPEMGHPPTYCSTPEVQYYFNVMDVKRHNVKLPLTCYWHTKIDTSTMVDAFIKFAKPLGRKLQPYKMSEEFKFVKWCTHTWVYDGEYWTNQGTKCESVGPRLY